MKAMSSSEVAGPTAIVIGAGVSGLACAAELVKAGHNVTILEARDRIGGRTHTIVDQCSGAKLDLGASFIHGLAGNPLTELAKQQNLRLVRSGHTKNQIWSPEGPPLPDELAAKLGFNSMRAIFSTSVEYAQERAEGAPPATESLADYILDGKKSTLFDGLDESDKVYAAQMARAWDGWIGATLQDTSLRYWQSDVTFEGPDAVIADGYAGIYEPLADIARQSRWSQIRLREPVTAIMLSDDGGSVSVETQPIDSTVGNDGTSSLKRMYSAPFCVCTIPLGVLQRNPPTFTPPLPKRRLAATHRIGMGLLNKIVMTYDKAFWPSKQSFLTMLPSKHSEEFLPMLKDRALMAQNYISVTGKNQLVFYCGARFGEELENLTDEYISKHIHKILTYHFCRGEAAVNFPGKPDSIIVTRWNSDRYACGSYSFVMPAKANEIDQPSPLDYAELARPQWNDRLHFAGEATDLDHYATVHGPLLTGRREA